MLSLRRRIYRGVRRFFSAGARKRLRDLLARLDDADEQEIRRTLERLCQPHKELFRASVALLRLQLARLALRRRDPAALQRDSAELRALQEDDGMSWNEQRAAAILEATIPNILGEEPDGAEAVKAAFDAFLAFRGHSLEPVPAALRLIPRVARQRRRDLAAGLAYIEFLAALDADEGDRDGACDRTEVESALRGACDPEEHIGLLEALDLVCEPDVYADGLEEARGALDPAAGADLLRALQCACDPGVCPEALETVRHADAGTLASAARLERLNGVAREICGFPWAALNLARLHLHHRDFARAKQEFDEAGSPPGDADTSLVELVEYERGATCLGLRQWAKAAGHFEQVTAGPLAPAAGAFRIIALLRDRDDKLRRDRRSQEEVLDELAGWERELVGLLGAAGKPPVHEIVPVLVDLARRLRGHRDAWRLLVALELPHRLPRSARERLARMVFESEHHAAADLLPAESRRAGPLDDLRAGRRLLERGQLTPFADRFSGRIDLDAGARPATCPEFRLLQADYQIRTGEPAAAEPLLRREAPVDGGAPIACELRARACLGRGEAEIARRLMEAPQATLLSRVRRELCLAEALDALGRTGDAHEHFVDALRRCPGSPGVLVALGFSYRAIGRDDVAGECFARALRGDDRNVYARLGGAPGDSSWPDAAADLCELEPAIALLARPVARRMERAGRRDLVDSWRTHLQVSLCPRGQEDERSP